MGSTESDSSVESRKSLINHPAGDPKWTLIEDNGPKEDSTRPRSTCRDSPSSREISILCTSTMSLWKVKPGAARSLSPGEIVAPPMKNRTKLRRIGLVAFTALFLLGQPPIVHGLANRIDPWFLGMPFLYWYLLSVYAGMIGVLLWGYLKGL